MAKDAWGNEILPETQNGAPENNGAPFNQQQQQQQKQVPAEFAGMFDFTQTKTAVLNDFEKSTSEVASQQVYSAELQFGLSKSLATTIVDIELVDATQAAVTFANGHATVIRANSVHWGKIGVGQAVTIFPSSEPIGKVKDANGNDVDVYRWFIRR